MVFTKTLESLDLNEKQSFEGFCSCIETPRQTDCLQTNLLTFSNDPVI